MQWPRRSLLKVRGRLLQPSFLVRALELILLNLNVSQLTIVVVVPVSELVVCIEFVQFRAYLLRVHMASAHSTAKNVPALGGCSLLPLGAWLDESPLIQFCHH